jgi:uncharacterized protein YndB with AHSA1/START domain
MIKNIVSIFVTTAVLLGSIVAVTAVVGLTLPESHQIARSARFSAPPAAVYAVISDVAHYADWRSDIDRVEVLPDDGEGVRFAEYAGEDVVTYRIEEATPPTRLKVRIDDASLPFGGTWTYLLQPLEGGTSLTITEDGTIGNPIFRVVAKVLFSPTDSMDRYLHDLSGIESLGGRR